MSFDDEARQIGVGFLDLIPGTLRERSRSLSNKYGIHVSYASYDKLWSSLVGQVGIVDAVRGLLRDCIESMSPETEQTIRKSARETMTTKELGALDADNAWWAVDDQTSRISPLGSFVLTYGADHFRDLGRLSSVKVYRIAASLYSLLQAREDDEVVFLDGSAQEHGDSKILGHLRALEQLLAQHGLAMLEHDRLRGLIDKFEETYARQYAPRISSEDQRLLFRVLEKLESAISQEIVARDFSELRPVTGTFDYQKPDSHVLTGLVGESAASVPALVRQDLEESIKCLKFGAATASVMLSLRAVEGYLRELYSELHGSATKKAWAEVIKAVQSALASKNVAIDPALGFLEYLRSVRNTADHPDAVFDQVAAEQTLMHATSAIRELHKVRGI